MLLWVAKCCDGTTDIYAVPIDTEKFMLHHVSKVRHAPAAAPPTMQPMQIATPVFATHQYMASSSYLQMYATNPLPPLFPHPSSHSQTDSTSTSCDIQSSPVCDIDATVEEICTKYKLDGDNPEGLKKLRFELGDKLTRVSEES